MRLIDGDALCSMLSGGTILAKKEFILSQLDTEAFARFVTENCPTIDPVKHANLHDAYWDEAWCEWGVCSCCGEENMSHAKFCNWCGAKLDADEGDVV